MKMRRFPIARWAAGAALLPVLAALLLTFTAPPATNAQSAAPPPPEEVYPYTARATANAVVLRFDVREHHYLYRSAFGFVTETPGITLGAPRFPNGEMHSDEYSDGPQEIYRGVFEVAVPYRRTGAATAVALEMDMRGCREVDPALCYIPWTWTANVPLPAAPSPLADLLGAGGTSRADEPLPIEDAFHMNARFDGPNEVTFTWQIADGYYLYRDKFELTADGGIGLGRPQLPDGEPHRDENFGDVEIYRDFVSIAVPFNRAGPDALDVTLTAGFQGCKDDSICYSPHEQTMALVLPAVSEFPATASGSGSAQPPVSEQDRLARIASTAPWWAMLGTFYVAGLLLSFTPCVLPMVPILSSIIAGGGNGATTSTSRGFALSVSYVLGMAVTYTAAGALSALAGEQIQAAFQKPWIIGLFAGMFAVLALGMFGLYELQMPAAIQTRLANLANRQRTGSFVGTAIIGALSALIVTTCVAPPLVATLAVIGQSGDVARGSAALFAMSIGMGTPLLAVGASAGTLLPKVGPWMNAVKGAFGFMMMGLAIWMLERVLPGSVTLAMWAVLVFLGGVFLGAFEPLPASPKPVQRLAKGFGVLACLYGALLLIGATLGGENPLRPIPQTGFAGRPGTAAPELPFREIETVAELEAELAAASMAGRPVMVDFTADWCSSCKELEEYTFTDPGVIAALTPFVLLRADVTETTDDDKALLQYFKSVGPPTLAFYDAGGRAQDAYRLYGYVPADEFKPHVESVAAL